MIDLSMAVIPGRKLKRWRADVLVALRDVLRKRKTEHEPEPYFRTARELRDYRAARQASLQWDTM